MTHCFQCAFSLFIFLIIFQWNVHATTVKGNGGPHQADNVENYSNLMATPYRTNDSVKTRKPSCRLVKHTSVKRTKFIPLNFTGASIKSKLNSSSNRVLIELIQKLLASSVSSANDSTITSKRPSVISHISPKVIPNLPKFNVLILKDQESLALPELKSTTEQHILPDVKPAVITTNENSEKSSTHEYNTSNYLPVEKLNDLPDILLTSTNITKPETKIEKYNDSLESIPIVVLSEIEVTSEEPKITAHNFSVLPEIISVLPNTKVPNVTVENYNNLSKNIAGQISNKNYNITKGIHEPNITVTKYNVSLETIPLVVEYLPEITSNSTDTEKSKFIFDKYNNLSDIIPIAIQYLQSQKFNATPEIPLYSTNSTEQKVIAPLKIASLDLNDNILDLKHNFTFKGVINSTSFKKPDIITEPKINFEKYNFSYNETTTVKIPLESYNVSPIEYSLATAEELKIIKQKYNASLKNNLLQPNIKIPKIVVQNYTNFSEIIMPNNVYKEDILKATGVPISKLSIKKYKPVINITEPKVVKTFKIVPITPQNNILEQNSNSTFKNITSVNNFKETTIITPSITKETNYNSLSKITPIVVPVQKQKISFKHEFDLNNTEKPKTLTQKFNVSTENNFLTTNSKIPKIIIQKYSNLSDIANTILNKNYNKTTEDILKNTLNITVEKYNSTLETIPMETYVQVQKYNNKSEIVLSSSTNKEPNVIETSEMVTVWPQEDILSQKNNFTFEDSITTSVNFKEPEIVTLSNINQIKNIDKKHNFSTKIIPVVVPHDVSSKVEVTLTNTEKPKTITQKYSDLTEIILGAADIDKYNNNLSEITSNVIPTKNNPETEDISKISGIQLVKVPVEKYNITQKTVLITGNNTKLKVTEPFRIVSVKAKGDILDQKNNFTFQDIPFNFKKLKIADENTFSSKKNKLPEIKLTSTKNADQDIVVQKNNVSSKTASSTVDHMKYNITPEILFTITNSSTPELIIQQLNTSLDAITNVVALPVPDQKYIASTKTVFTSIDSEGEEPSNVFYNYNNSTRTISTIIKHSPNQKYASLKNVLPSTKKPMVLRNNATFEITPLSASSLLLKTYNNSLKNKGVPMNDMKLNNFIKKYNISTSYNPNTLQQQPEIKLFSASNEKNNYADNKILQNASILSVQHKLENSYNVPPNMVLNKYNDSDLQILQSKFNFTPKTMPIILEHFFKKYNNSPKVIVTEIKNIQPNLTTQEYSALPEVITFSTNNTNSSQNYNILPINISHPIPPQIYATSKLAPNFTSEVIFNLEQKYNKSLKHLLPAIKNSTGYNISPDVYIKPQVLVKKYKASSGVTLSSINTTQFNKLAQTYNNSLKTVPIRNYNKSLEQFSTALDPTNYNNNVLSENESVLEKNPKASKISAFSSKVSPEKLIQKYDLINNNSSDLTNKSKVIISLKNNEPGLSIYRYNVSNKDLYTPTNNLQSVLLIQKSNVSTENIPVIGKPSVHKFNVLPDMLSILNKSIQPKLVVQKHNITSTLTNTSQPAVLFKKFTNSSITHPNKLDHLADTSKILLTQTKTLEPKIIVKKFNITSNTTIKPEVLIQKYNITSQFMPIEMAGLINKYNVLPDVSAKSIQPKLAIKKYNATSKLLSTSLNNAQAKKSSQEDYIMSNITPLINTYNISPEVLVHLTEKVDRKPSSGNYVFFETKSNSTKNVQPEIMFKEINISAKNFPNVVQPSIYKYNITPNIISLMQNKQFLADNYNFSRDNTSVLDQNYQPHQYYNISLNATYQPNLIVKNFAFPQKVLLTSRNNTRPEWTVLLNRNLSKDAVQKSFSFPKIKSTWAVNNNKSTLFQNLKTQSKLNTSKYLTKKDQKQNMIYNIKQDNAKKRRLLLLEAEKNKTLSTVKSKFTTEQSDILSTDNYNNSSPDLLLTTQPESKSTFKLVDLQTVSTSLPDAEVSLRSVNLNSSFNLNEASFGTQSISSLSEKPDLNLSTINSEFIMKQNHTLSTDSHNNSSSDLLITIQPESKSSFELVDLQTVSTLLPDIEVSMPSVNLNSSLKLNDDSFGTQPISSLSERPELNLSTVKSEFTTEQSDLLSTDNYNNFSPDLLITIQPESKSSFKLVDLQTVSTLLPDTEVSIPSENLNSSLKLNDDSFGTQTISSLSEKPELNLSTVKSEFTTEQSDLLSTDNYDNSSPDLLITIQPESKSLFNLVDLQTVSTLLPDTKVSMPSVNLNLSLKLNDASFETQPISSLSEKTNFNLSTVKSEFTTEQSNMLSTDNNDNFTPDLLITIQPESKSSFKLIDPQIVSTLLPDAEVSLPSVNFNSSLKLNDASFETQPISSLSEKPDLNLSTTMFHPQITSRPSLKFTTLLPQKNSEQHSNLFDDTLLNSTSSSQPTGLLPTTQNPVNLSPQLHNSQLVQNSSSNLMTLSTVNHNSSSVVIDRLLTMLRSQIIDVYNSNENKQGNVIESKLAPVFGNLSKVVEVTSDVKYVDSNDTMPPEVAHLSKTMHFKIALPPEPVKVSDMKKPT